MDRSDENDDIVKTARIDVMVSTVSISTSEKPSLRQVDFTLRPVWIEMEGRLTFTFLC